MTNLDRIAAIRAAWAADRAERTEHWRKHWPMELVHIAADLGFGVLLGFGLGLAVLLLALERLA